MAKLTSTPVPPPAPALTDFNTDSASMTLVDAMLNAFFTQDYANVLTFYKGLRGSARIMACAQVVQAALSGLMTQATFITWVASQLDPNDVQVAAPILAQYLAGDLDDAWVSLNQLPAAVPIVVIQAMAAQLTANDATGAATTAFLNWVQRIS